MGFPLLTRMHLREKGEAFLARKMSVGVVRIIVVSGEYRLFADLATCYVNAIKRYAIEGKRFRRPAGMGARLWAVKVCGAAMRTERSPLLGCRQETVGNSAKGIVVRRLIAVGRQ